MKRSWNPAAGKYSRAEGKNRLKDAVNTAPDTELKRKRLMTQKIPWLKSY
jgi:hypothetical protein